ncbi:hypothetical protein [Thalassomonas actiniarum]|uniref:Uncharacterized protein n=1 Tax=Thalassomonas actiniarum TaxID=485447 RepID=A0AAE9YUB9_9GAMM|nr:hypothetical protein [Thalassomonas actiniarum]WDE01251.1 hypothetical protein SG35_011755 [Thalassomonas actiniarum]
MAKPNDMPEFRSVKVSLTENIPAQIARQPLPAYATHTSTCANSYTPFTNKGGCYHV